MVDRVARFMLVILYILKDYNTGIINRLINIFLQSIHDGYGFGIKSRITPVYFREQVVYVLFDLLRLFHAAVLLPSTVRSWPTT